MRSISVRTHVDELIVRCTPVSPPPSPLMNERVETSAWERRERLLLDILADTLSDGTLSLHLSQCCIVCLLYARLHRYFTSLPQLRHNCKPAFTRVFSPSAHCWIDEDDFRCSSMKNEFSHFHDKVFSAACCVTVPLFNFSVATPTPTPTPADGNLCVF